ncbi:GntR family transcriptional regulator [Arvimicrobium flavum]|uniref:GntR family transcriptional regulator n=1 Tax=Arvimicrobium flavum TaxID=3393320 RepID=UPI00237A347D|nr:GntR family transcriptional regulator [Mesorhizobium shangrilense]
MAEERAIPGSEVASPEQSDSHKVARVTQQIREMILRDELKPGFPIRERALAERLDVSRTPTREALKILAAEGLVELSPNRGAWVSILTRNEVFQIVQVLSALEGLAAELACEAMTQEQMDELWALHYEMLAFKARKARLDYFHNNQAIHLAIVRASGNDTLMEHHRILNARVYRLRYLAHQTSVAWDAAVREHEELLQFLQDRNAPAAAQALRTHVFSIWTRLSELIASDGTLIP